MKQLKQLVFAAAVFAAILSSCTPTSEPSAPKAVPAPKNVPAPKAESASAKPVESAKPVPLEPAGPNLLHNASFEIWTADEKIGAWNLAEGNENWTPILGKKIPGAPQGGSTAIELPPPSEGKQVVLSQTIGPDKVIPLRRLALSAKVNSPEKEAVHMTLNYRINEKTETVRRVSHGIPGWEKLSAEFWVPKEADPASFRIQFVLHSGVKSPVQIDDVRMQLMSPKGSLPAKPAAPATDKPAAPVADKPATPAADLPAVPAADKPGALAADKPGDTAVDKPAIQTPQVDTATPAPVPAAAKAEVNSDQPAKKNTAKQKSNKKSSPRKSSENKSTPAN
jgi:hypothetical protein